MSLNKEDIQNVLSTLVDSFEKKDLELYGDLIDKFTIKKYDRVGDFDIGVLYPFRKFQRLLIQNLFKTKDNDLVFLIQQYSFVEGHFNRLFEKYEGSFACADKSRTILNRLFDFYTEGEEIEFNYDAEYTYHFPKTMLKTHDSIVEFYKSLISLYHGSSDSYILNLGKVLSTREEPAADE